MNGKHKSESRGKRGRSQSERAAAERKRKQRRWVVSLAVAALAVGGAGYFSYGGAGQADASTAAAPVVTASPFKAIHEMRKGPPVPFLPASQPQPRIAVPTKVHDFGTIGPKDVVRYRFQIRNEGQGPLTISRAFTTCGCTTARVSARVIPPGKAASVELIFDAGFHDARWQSVKRGLVIESNDRGRWKTTVWTEAKVRRS